MNEIMKISHLHLIFLKYWLKNRGVIFPNNNKLNFSALVFNFCLKLVEVYNKMGKSIFYDIKYL